MSGNSQQKIKRVTIIYWLLLFYIVAALAWWFISLENQNRQIQHFLNSRQKAEYRAPR